MRSPDSALRALLLDRARLSEQLAAVLARVGPHHPDRATRNAERAPKRRRLRRALRQNAEAIAARCATLYQE